MSPTRTCLQGDGGAALWQEGHCSIYVDRGCDSQLETTSLLNGVHNEKQIGDALREIGRADLIGSSNLSPSIPFYEKNSNELCRYICAIKTFSRRIPEPPNV